MNSVNSAIVLVIDRLGAGYLGPYGNTWLETPGFNRLASQSLLCEHLLANSPDLAIAYRSYWQGGNETTSLPQLARLAGCHTVLVTDDEAIAQLPGAADFDELHLVKHEPAKRPAEEIEQTSFIRLLDAALAQLEAWKETDRPQLLWIHARAMNGSWDAPLELRQQFADEDDPTPSESVEPPQQLLAKDHDPDELLQLAHAYAGQVSVIDSGLQAILHAIDELPQRDSLLFAVTSPRGYPLGEHLRLGECDQALYGELLHVPCCVRFPHGEGALLRTQELCQPADLFATLADANGWATDETTQLQSLLRIVRGEPAVSRDVLLAAAGQQQLVRTSAWQLRVVQNDDGEQFELYAKPDDRWEFNDVASRAGDIARQLAELAKQPVSGGLAEELTSPWR
ncbi:sulfatase family protein [Anatilimnocola floriformis]|uniref:sulfatase family protein n=1 Tax=Anatilimnocola floriformis TaxID=2948575 RepID=UPI0020C313E0|nr:sulfatase-like hydrolase/transferase [Anatilimnocola floriformis]